MSLLLLRAPGGTFQISDPALSVLLTQRQLSADDREAGGLILGRLLLNSRDAIVDEVSTPVREDRRGRFFFKRARRPAQDKVRAAWIASDRAAQYLGEWHTHPEPRPSPSNEDLRDWRRLLTVTICEHASLFFAIVGQQQIRVWEGNRSTGVIDELQPADRGMT